MSRWEPDAADRLRATAMRLYVARGYDQVTVAEIAAEAGLTARTFFRYFGDKREVLFAGSEELLRQMVGALVGAPPAAAPMDAVAASLATAADVLGGDRDWSRQRARLIATHADLQERELIKLSGLASELARGLRDRGVVEPAASLAADSAVACLRIAFERWVATDDGPSLAELMSDTLGQLRAVATA